MFRFEDPQYLYLLVVIPLLVLISFHTYRKRKKRLRKFGDPSLLKALMPDVSRWRPGVKLCLLLLALASLIVMLARPQLGTKISHEKRTGIETIIAMDISNSMRAEDVSPSRLDRSKMMVENMVDKFTNDKIGLIVFAGDAFVQLPITSDFVSAKMFLSNIDPSMIATQGTENNSWMVDESNSIVIDADPLNIADRIEQFLNNPEKLKKLREAGLKYAASTDWDVETEKVYKSVVEGIREDEQKL